MTFWLTVYVLIWPVIVALCLFLMSRAVYRDYVKAKKAGRKLV